jgi:hypothetical protein
MNKGYEEEFKNVKSEKISDSEAKSFYEKCD